MAELPGTVTRTQLRDALAGLGITTENLMALSWTPHTITVTYKRDVDAGAAGLLQAVVTIGVVDG